MWMQRLFSIAVLVLPAAWASDLTFCIQNPSALDRMTVESFRRELSSTLSQSQIRATFDDCGPSSLRIALAGAPPVEERSALARTLVRNGRVEPAVDLFVDAIAQLIDCRLPAVLGRAMARVALHEVGHYLNQGEEHDRAGLMMPYYSPAHLMAADSRMFRLKLK